MPTRIDTILFDAINTLWHVQHSVVEMWDDGLTRLNAPRSLKEIVSAIAEHESWLTPQIVSFETSGQPVADETIQAFWLEFDQRVLSSLDISVPDETVVSKLFPAFFDFTLYQETVSVLETLRETGYRIAIVSNGAYQQNVAIELGIEQFFESIIGSWHVGFMKPDPEIFQVALREMGVSTEQALMVGDTWDADVVGARSLGIRTLHLRRDEAIDESKDEISSLHGVIDFLDRQEQ